MRLTSSQQQIIESTVAEVAGNAAQVWLFGSRRDDTRRGGDVDLLVRASPAISLLQRARIKLRLERALNLPVDVVAAPLDDGLSSPFARLALSTGERLGPAGPGWARLGHEHAAFAQGRTLWHGRPLGRMV